jgi:hypothetical protein
MPPKKDKPYNKNEEPDPKNKPVLPPSRIREDLDTRGKTSRATVARRQAKQKKKDK